MPVLNKPDGASAFLSKPAAIPTGFENSKFHKRVFYKTEEINIKKKSYKVFWWRILTALLKKKNLLNSIMQNKTI